VNPILIDLSKQLPSTAKTSIFIHQSKKYKDIAAQAKSEMDCLKKYDVWVEEDQEVEIFLKENGYEKWLSNCENEDRLKLIGFLKLLIELCEDLIEEDS
tara:strand:- start:1352 stop:1648 length:297 start_codon:yes stop_codon:yes gene_type:complete